MNDEEILKVFLILSIFLWVGFGMVSVESAMNGYQATIQNKETQYHNGSFMLERLRNPQDKSSKGLYHFIEIIDREARNVSSQ